MSLHDLCLKQASMADVSYCAAWRLMGSAMYTGMSTLQQATPDIERGMALHKMIRLVWAW